jgi:hypothetical protein
VKSTTTAFAQSTASLAPLTFTPVETMHPFAVVLSVRAQEDGPVLSVAGSTLNATNYTLMPAGQPGGGASVAISTAQVAAINNLDSRLSSGPQAVADARSALLRAALNPASSAAALSTAAEALAAAEQSLAGARAEAFAAIQATAEKLSPAQTRLVAAAAGRGASLQTFGQGGGAIVETELTPGATFMSTVAVRGGVWTYGAANGSIVTSTVKADSGWHQVAVSHYTARGETLFFVDGKLAGRTPERLQPKSFSVGGPAISTNPDSSHPIDLRDLLIYRSALNEDEVAALQEGTLFQSSLEIYAPLADTQFAPGAPVENRAQSLTYVTAGPGLSHRDR